ncbi:hypothetical protein G6011_09276 [Alternaria panax]|uniref:Uncharacterized protein n=1 Tax=Alternaria panax TaxID=48097 RepID=A0AAD4IAZ8_9PLEO|nr:hypothetical protein G6011_09276 [Alternaria panax]
MLSSVSPVLIVTCFPVPAPVVGVAGEEAGGDTTDGNGEADPIEVTRVVGSGDGVEASMRDVESVVGGRAADAVAKMLLLAAQRLWMCRWTCALVVERKRVERAKRSVVGFM